MSHNPPLASSWHLLHLCLHPLSLSFFSPFFLFRQVYFHLFVVSPSVLSILFPTAVSVSKQYASFYALPLNMYFVSALHISGTSFPQPHSLSSFPPSFLIACASLFLLQPLLLRSLACIPRWKDIMVPTGLKAQVGVGSCPSLSLISAISLLGGSRCPEGAGQHPHAASHVLST